MKCNKCNSDKLIKYYLAFDPSLSETGYAVLTEFNVFTDYNFIRPNKKLTEAGKLHFIRVKIDNLIKTWLPHEIVFESPFVGLNPNTALKLGSVRGIILEIAENYHIPHYEYAPTEIKAAIAHGRATKDEVRKAARLITGIDTPNDNVSDAIAVGLCHTANKRWQERLKAGGMNI